MRHLLRIVAALSIVSSLSLTGLTQLHSPAAHAQTWNTNPSPFQHTKVPISPMALLGLSRQRAGGGARAQVAPGGGGGDYNPTLPQPQKPTGSAGSAGQVGSGGFSAPGPQGGIDRIPRGSILFNNDPSAMEQNETSVTVRQISGSAGSGGGDQGSANGASPNDRERVDAVVGGVNDFRGFYFVPGLCGLTSGTYCYPARNCDSGSGFSVSLNGGRSLTKSGCLPWANDTFQPNGDPSVDRDTSGNVFFGSLGFDMGSATSPPSNRNGIIIERSTPALFDPHTGCQNAVGSGNTVSTNPCWKGRVVFVGTTAVNPNTGKCDLGYCTFADKDWIAVDRYSGTPYQGDVYVTWNSFNVAGPNANTSQMMLSRCHPDPKNTDPTGFLYCTTPIAVNMPSDQFTGGGSYLTVTRDGHVLVAYINFGTPTSLYPIDYRIAVVAPGGQSVQGWITQAHLTDTGDSTTIPCLPNRSPSDSFEAGAPCEPNMGIDAAAGVTFRLPEFYKIDADRSMGPNQNTVYTTFELCTVPQYYPLYMNPSNPNEVSDTPVPGFVLVYPGNCPKSDVLVATTKLSFTTTGFTSTPTSYQDVTRSAPGQQFFPYVTVDDGTGEAVVTYNSTQDDPFQNMDSVYAQQSTDGGQNWSPLRGTFGGRITDIPYQITKDPAGYFGQGYPACGPSGSLPNAAGCPGYAPQNGDYLQSVAFFGQLYTHYTGTYVQKGFFPDPSQDAATFFDAAYPMNQDDNFLATNQLTGGYERR